jgi:glycosyltransferase involved in cell wall biosynthesis
MKPIIHITWEYPPFSVGELSNWLYSIIPRLANYYPLVIITRGNEDNIFRLNNLTIYRVGSLHKTHPHILTYAHLLNLDFVRAASNIIHDNGGALLIHSHDWISSIAAYYISLYLKCPFIISVYTTEIKRAGKIDSLLKMGIFDIEKKCFENADIIMVRDEEIKNHLIADYNIDRNKIFFGRNHDEIISLYRRIIK